MITLFPSRKHKKLNSRTPQWFRDWHSSEFLPIKIRQDFLMILFLGIFIAIIVDMVAR